MPKNLRSPTLGPTSTVVTEKQSELSSVKEILLELNMLQIILGSKQKNEAIEDMWWLCSSWKELYSLK